MAKKININTAPEKELLKIKGIGTATVKKILEMRDKGITIDTEEELYSSTGISEVYKDSISDAVVFEPVDLLKTGTLVGPGVDIPTVAKFPDLTPAFPENFADIVLDRLEPGLKFELSIASDSVSDNSISFEGYYAVISYRLNNYMKGAWIKKPTYRSIERHFDSDGSLHVLLSKEITAKLVDDQFRITLHDPDRNIILQRNEHINDGDTIHLSLPAQTPKSLKIIANKNLQENYRGFKLNYSVGITTQSGKSSHTGTIELGRENETIFEPDHNEKIDTVSISVLTSQNRKIFDESFEPNEFALVNGVHVLDIELPLPSSENYKIRLIEDVDVINNPYHDHKLVAIYDVLETETLNLLWRSEDTFAIEADGTAKVDLKHYGIIRHIELQVKSPTGEIISKRAGSYQDFSALTVIEIKVPPREVISSPDGFVQMPKRPQKSLCRLLDPNGKKIFTDVQVVFYTAKKENPTEDDFFPTFFARTEDNGYFYVDIPSDYYSAAFARVGVSHGQDTYADVDIQLVPDTVLRVSGDQLLNEKKLFFPEKMLLVVDSDEEDDDKECGSCSKMDFHKSRAVLDEFSFYSVVRTTEPDIQGYTLHDDGEMSVREIKDMISITDGFSHEELPPNYLDATVRKDVLLKHINLKKGLTVATLQKAVDQSNAFKLRNRILPQKKVEAKGRQVLDFDTAVDWDEEPTIYQATSVAHGHLLHFKQEWVSDGYSLGDLIYSLPLAPGQKKQIVVLDWEHRAAASRTEELDYQDALANTLSRDRDIDEIVNGTLKERTHGESSAGVSGWGAGGGLGFISGSVGGLLGVAGGSSNSSSTAWQNSSRNTTLGSSQSLRDRTMQSASSVRSQRGTVVHTATEGEKFSVQTESVANYNHCHSMTLQYFEVLRHLKVEQRLAEVQESLFIPLNMSPFDYQKILRWRESLSNSLINRRLRRGFEAIERIENDYEGSDFPEQRYADEAIEHIQGSINLQFNFGLPVDLTMVDDLDAVRESLSAFVFFYPDIYRHYEEILEANVAERQRLFDNYIAPEIAATFVKNLRFVAVIESSVGSSEFTFHLPMEATLTSRFRAGKSLHISLRQNSSMPPGLIRSRLVSINIYKASGVILSDGETLLSKIPQSSNIIVKSAHIRYRTNHYSGTLFRSNHVNDDLLGYSAGELSDDYARLATPLSRREMINPRNEDIEKATSLQDHLNDNLEYYHQAVWLQMSPERRFMFLDGIQVTDYSEAEQYPLGVVRSVASVVENKVIGIVGNSLVMPVAPGFRLDPNQKGKEVDLFSLYRPTTPFEPIRMSLPTKGVFAEAVMGSCNSCEKIEEDRFWRWGDEPVPDSPTSILPVSTEERTSGPLDTRSDGFTSPIINLQNAPSAPDPQGVNAALQLLGNPNIFRDITGLTENQRNAISAFQTSLSTAQAFGSQAGQLATVGAKLQTIKDIADARSKNLLSQGEAEKLTAQALQANIENPGPNTSPNNSTIPSRDTLDDVIRQSLGSDNSRLRVERRGDNEVLEFERGRSETNDRNDSDGRTNNQSGGGSQRPSSPDDEESEQQLEEIIEEADNYSPQSVASFGADNLANERPALPLLTAYLSQYEGNIRIPKYANEIFNLNEMQGQGQSLKYDHINACLSNGPQTMSWLIDQAESICASQFSAYLAAHNHLRTLAVGARETSFEQMAMPWSRIEDEGTLETAVYLSRRYFDIDGNDFEDDKLSFPKGSLSDTEFFNGKSANGQNASAFYVMNQFADGPFQRLEDQGFGRDLNDRYHYCLAMTVANGIASGSVSDSVVSTDLLPSWDELTDLDSMKTAVAGIAYSAGIHLGVSWLKNKLLTLWDPRDRQPDAHENAWYYMNALSFLEGSNYGSDYTNDMDEAQLDVQRESRVHMAGVIESLRRLDPTLQIDHMYWHIPIPNLFASKVQGFIHGAIDELLESVSFGISGFAQLPILFSTFVDKFNGLDDLLSEELWPYIYEVINSDEQITVPYKESIETPTAFAGDLDPVTTPILPNESRYEELVTIAGTGISPAVSAIAKVKLVNKIQTLGEWFSINFPSTTLVIEHGWYDYNSHGSELLHPLHWEGKAALIRVSDGDLTKLERMTQLASMLFYQMELGQFDNAQGDKLDMLRVFINEGDNDGTEFRLIEEMVDLPTATTNNTSWSSSLGWDAFTDSIYQFFGIESPTDQALALLTAEFQRSEGYSDQSINGELNASTWDLLSQYLFAGPRRGDSGLSSESSDPIYYVIDHLAYLRDENNLDSVLLDSSGEKRLIPVDSHVQFSEQLTAVISGKPQEVVKAIDPNNGNLIGWTKLSNLRYFYKDNVSRPIQLAPESPISTTGLTGVKKTIAEEYNAYGGLINSLATLASSSSAKKIAALMLAFIKKEGRRFVVGDSESPPRPVTRFENHVLYKVWITRPSDQNKINETEKTRRKDLYDAHFKPRIGSANHKMCSSGSCSGSQWKTVHAGGSVYGLAFANLQHEAIDIATSIASEELAYVSSSFGAPQILGTGHRELCGFNSAKSLYQAFYSSESQIIAQLDFINNKARSGKTIIEWCLDASFGSESNWGKIAGAYNGDGRTPGASYSGNDEPYAKGLKAAYLAAIDLLN